MWALDTNTLIYFFKGEGQVAQHLLSHSPGDICLPTVVLYELEVGIAKSSSPEKRSRQLADLVAAVRVLPFGRAEAKAAADIRAAMEKRGTPIGPYDTLIAGTALANGATLVTRNLNEFGRIDALRVENWFD